jgi:hypothetical protein
MKDALKSNIIMDQKKDRLTFSGLIAADRPVTNAPRIT